MDGSIDILKGIHPGYIVERELKKHGRQKGQFALDVHEYPSTLSAILKGKRNMNTALAMRIERELGLEEGFLMILQVFYEIDQEKKKKSKLRQPDVSKFRPAIFWDTKPENIDWDRQKRAIIERVFERGNYSEKKELIKYYGRTVIESTLRDRRKT